MAELLPALTIIFLSGFLLGLYFDQNPGLLLTRSSHDRGHHLQQPERVLGDISILFVLDPNFFLCWESVPVDQASNTTLLPWILGLKDALSRTADNPDGLDLKVVHSCTADAGKCLRVACLLGAPSLLEQHTRGAHAQIPDPEHSTPEVAGFATFKGLIQSTWQDGAAHVTLPSNLILMYQAVMCGTLFSS